MRRALGLSVLAGVAACQDSTPPVVPRDFTLKTPEVWSGGEASVASPVFAPPAALPVVLLDNDTLSVRRLDDTTVVARLPDLPGNHTLRVVAPNVVSVGTTIHLSGFHDAAVGPSLQGMTQPWLNPTRVLGNGPTGLRMWDVSRGLTLDYPDSMHQITCSRGVGPSYAPGRVVLSGPPGCQLTSRWYVWSLVPTGLRLDSIQSGTNRIVGELSPGRHFVALIHSFALEVCDTSCTSEFLPAEGPHDVVISPDGSRAAVVAYRFGVLGSAPVLDASTAQISYLVTELQTVDGAAFTAAGDTLFLVGEDTTGQSRLVVTRASNGSILASLPLEVRANAVALDQTRPWLYVTGYRSLSAGQALEVYDRHSLTRVATVGVPSGEFCQFICGFVRILPSPLERRLYVISTWDGDFEPTAQAMLARFDTPP